MSKHTPEPWTFDRHAYWSEWLGNITGHYPVDEHGHQTIRTISCQTKYGPLEEQVANAERIVACVNALAGLNPEAVGAVVEALELITLTYSAAMEEIGVNISELKSITRAKEALAALKEAKQ